MTDQKDFLEKIIQALNKAQIPYMLSGSLASSFYGRPRATNDVDIVIAPTEKQLILFVQSLGKNYYVSLDAVRSAFKNNSTFNIIDIQAGWKADIIIRKDRPFSSEEFQRRKNYKIMGMDIWATSPEDAILTKLEWAKESDSELHFNDAFGIAVVQWEQLDTDYLTKWAKDLKVENSLKKLIKKVQESLS